MSKLRTEICESIQSINPYATNYDRYIRKPEPKPSFIVSGNLTVEHTITVESMEIAQYLVSLLAKDGKIVTIDDKNIYNGRVGVLVYKENAK